MVNLNDHEATLSVAQIEAKKELKNCICPLHKRKGRVSFDFDNDGANAYITAYCCSEHAQSMSQTLKEIQLFNTIVIKNK